MRILFVGDIVGHEGLNFCADYLPLLKRDINVDFCIVNGENSDAGKGITKKQAQKLLSSGVDVITGGNHIWQKNSIDVIEDSSLRTLRPANYPFDKPGKGYIIHSSDSKPANKVAVINLQGRSFLPPIDCPFQKSIELVDEIKNETPIIFVDFHAEASAEKQALGWHLDGKVSALVGTHTHVQTADERILHKGTAYITDVGMTGPFDSVIGMDIGTAVQRFKTQLPKYFKLATRNIRLNGVVISINENTGKAQKITRLNFSKEDYGFIKNTQW
ncbi:MAG: TIGR00282 family metallophosphoesterase [Calditrichaeota bacterium]|nr:MAG: TIGR00282 family metallophosphoesterase [Calditrichota bacterium]MBL1204163.1 TIGR00282 family metallophosphoesterase [Calditrichota bacterium]NOG43994.1 TIGR00282 family metallophosphoesterase [Calditrichota bacterium]